MFINGWSTKTWLWTIFILAMVLRMLFIIPKGNRIAPPLRDQNTYYALGRALVDDGYLGPPVNQTVGPYYEFRENNPPPLGAVPEIRQKMMDRWDAEKRYYGVVAWDEPSSFFEPLYPLFSAGAYILFGDKFFFHRVLLGIMSSLTCLLIFGIGRRMFSETVGVIAGLISAVYPYFIFYTVVLMSETFLIFFMALTLYLFIRLRNDPGWKFAALFGISLGLTFLTRSIILGTVPFFIVYLILYNPKKLLLPVVISTVVFVMTISPWLIRNYNLHNQFVLLSTRGGYNIWLRNNPFYYEDELKALGYEIPEEYLENIQYSEFLDYPEFSPDQDEIERNRILTEEGLRFIGANPRLVTYLCWIRLQTLLGFHGTLAQSLIYKLVGVLTFGIFFPAALIAFFTNLKLWRDTLPLILIFGYFITVYTLTHDGIRYRLPADPCIIVLGSLLFAQVLHFFRLKLFKVPYKTPL
ncbi:MAG: glycosyltransferase family 39 protein [FCB group bacterium]|nr:glycosyltransferase family 39 protein [FCB group bacterium]